jgi:hypothetical protein
MSARVFLGLQFRLALTRLVLTIGPMCQGLPALGSLKVSHERLSTRLGRADENVLTLLVSGVEAVATGEELKRGDTRSDVET